MYDINTGGPRYAYMFGDGSTIPTTVYSMSAISQADLEAIAAVLCGGSPPSGYQIQMDGPPGVVKTY